MNVGRTCPRFLPGPVLRAKHPGTREKQYFATLVCGFPARQQTLETPFKRARDARNFAVEMAQALRTARMGTSDTSDVKDDDRRPETAA
jgi:hypothetical protein